MRKKISPRANRFLHATNPSDLSSIDLEFESITKETKYIEAGFNGLPYIKAGIRKEKIIGPRNKMLVKKDGKLYRIVGS